MITLTIDAALELRAWADNDGDPERALMMRLAAREIERLRAEVEALRKRSGDGAKVEPVGCPTPGACSCPE